jgi:hypothetical protein
MGLAAAVLMQESHGCGRINFAYSRHNQKNRLRAIRINFKGFNVKMFF